MTYLQPIAFLLNYILVLFRARYALYYHLPFLLKIASAKLHLAKKIQSIFYLFSINTLINLNISEIF